MRKASKMVMVMMMVMMRMPLPLVSTSVSGVVELMHESSTEALRLTRWLTRGCVKLKMRHQISASITINIFSSFPID
jgi:hypothetical protein